MEGSRVSDFSIERILSPQVGHKDFSADGYLRGVPGGFCLDSGNLRAPASVPVPVPVPVFVSGCVQYRGVSFGDAFNPYHTDFTGIYPNSGVFMHFSHDSADAQSMAGFNGFHQVPPQTRQKSRMRTVFTDSQTKQLEALFELTDYPAVEARAEVARSTGLSEETVRVWFKNRRARRKRSGSKVKSSSPPPPPPSAEAERKVFTSIL
ncbi:dharma [Mugil cephalus]|uniref:dharma n=1 Tax=Mugil cephalus TaxID=48193 RepID=UPI001FB7B145|nr:dharma [Mugil cephalus]